MGQAACGPVLKIDLTKWTGSGQNFNGLGQTSLDCVHYGGRLAINVSTVAQWSAAQAADALPRRPRDVWFQQSSNESLVCYHCPDYSFDDCCQCQCCGCTGREQRRPRRQGGKHVHRTSHYISFSTAGYEINNRRGC